MYMLANIGAHTKSASVGTKTTMFARFSYTGVFEFVYLVGAAGSNDHIPTKFVINNDATGTDAYVIGFWND
jgi:hypothetical protein